MPTRQTAKPAIPRPPFVLVRPFLFCFYRGDSYRRFWRAQRGRGEEIAILEVLPNFYFSNQATHFRKALDPRVFRSINASSRGARPYYNTSWDPPPGREPFLLFRDFAQVRSYILNFAKSFQRLSLKGTHFSNYSNFSILLISLMFSSVRDKTLEHVSQQSARTCLESKVWEVLAFDGQTGDVGDGSGAIRGNFPYEREDRKISGFEPTFVNYVTRASSGRNGTTRAANIDFSFRPRRTRPPFVARSATNPCRSSSSPNLRFPRCGVRSLSAQVE